MLLDLFTFTRLDETASGESPINALARIETSDRRGALAWSARGSMRGRHGTARLDLTVDGTIVLVCQRCLKPMQQVVRVANKFLVAADEDAADALDQDDDYDVVVGSATFDLDTLIEDEVILTLPSAPRHRDCPDGPSDLPRSTGKPSPFAALAALKSGGGRNDRDG